MDQVSLSRSRLYFWLFISFIILVSLFTGIYALKHPQIFKSKASEQGSIEIINNEGQNVDNVNTTQIQLQIIAPDWTQPQSFRLVNTVYATEYGQCENGWYRKGYNETTKEDDWDNCIDQGLTCVDYQGCIAIEPTIESTPEPVPDTPEVAQTVKISLNPEAIQQDSDCFDSFDPALRCLEVSYDDLTARGGRIDWFLPETEGEYTIYTGFISNKGNFKSTSKTVSLSRQTPQSENYVQSISETAENQAIYRNSDVAVEDYQRILADLKAVYGDQVIGWVWQEAGIDERRPSPVYSETVSQPKKDLSLQEALDRAGYIQAIGATTGALISNSSNSILKTFGSILKTLATNAGNSVFYAGTYMLLNPDSSGESILTVSQASALLEEPIEFWYVNYPDVGSVPKAVVKTVSLSEKLEKLGNLDIEYFPDKDPETGEERVVILPKPEVSVYQRALEVATFSAASEGAGRAVWFTGSKIINRVSGPVRTLYQRLTSSRVGSIGEEGFELLSSLDFDPIIRSRIQKTSTSLKEAYPQFKAEIFSTKGSAGVIYREAGSPDVLYKVSTKAEFNVQSTADFIDQVRYAEEEAKKIKILAEEGLAPRLIDYIPPKLTEEERTLLRDPSFGFRKNKANSLPNVSLPTSGKVSDTPIIVMERIDIDPEGFAKLASDPNRLQTQVRRVIEVLERHDLFPGDTELVVDTSGNLKFIDLGGMTPKTGSQFEDWSTAEEVLRKFPDLTPEERFLITGSPISKVDPRGEAGFVLPAISQASSLDELIAIMRAQSATFVDSAGRVYSPSQLEAEVRYAYINADLSDVHLPEDVINRIRNLILQDQQTLADDINLDQPLNQLFKQLSPYETSHLGFLTDSGQVVPASVLSGALREFKANKRVLAEVQNSAFGRKLLAQVERDLMLYSEASIQIASAYDQIWARLQTEAVGSGALAPADAARILPGARLGDIPLNQVPATGGLRNTVLQAQLQEAMELAEHDIASPVLTREWKGFARLTYEDLALEGAPAGVITRYGFQPVPNLSNRSEKGLAIAGLRTRITLNEDLLTGKAQGNLAEFLDWLKSLHQKQYYYEHESAGQLTQSSFPGQRQKTLYDIDGEYIIGKARVYNDPVAEIKRFPGKRITVELTEVPSEIRPYTYYGEEPGDIGVAIRHAYGPYDALNQYLEVMQRKILQLQQMGNGGSDEDAFRLMAEFYQYAINTHMFVEVNHSLFTNMVNHFLEARGYKPVQQGALDFYGYFFQQDSFYQVFVGEVKKVNPGI